MHCSAQGTERKLGRDSSVPATKGLYKHFQLCYNLQSQSPKRKDSRRNKTSATLKKREHHTNTDTLAQVRTVTLSTAPSWPYSPATHAPALRKHLPEVPRRPCAGAKPQPPTPVTTGGHKPAPGGSSEGNGLEDLPRQGPAGCGRPPPLPHGPSSGQAAGPGPV